MKDVQNQPDTRGIPINQVGVSDLRYPIIVLDRAFAARLQRLVDGYVAQARREPGGGPVTALSRGFRALPWFKQFF